MPPFAHAAEPSALHFLIPNARNGIISKECREAGSKNLMSKGKTTTEDHYRLK